MGKDEQMQNMTKRIQDSFRRTALGQRADFQLYKWQGFGNPMAAADGATSISPGARGAEFHFWSGSQAGMTDELSEASYFSESPYVQADGTWKRRYWGKNYPQLLDVKQRCDPHGTFWC